MTAAGWFTGGKTPHQIDYHVSSFNWNYQKFYVRAENQSSNGRKARKTGFVEPTHFFNKKLYMYLWAGEHSYSGYADMMACQNLGNWFRLENIRFTQNGDEINSRQTKTVFI